MFADFLPALSGMVFEGPFSMLKYKLLKIVNLTLKLNFQEFIDFNIKNQTLLRQLVFI